jgi:hypothetical protein
MNNEVQEEIIILNKMRYKNEKREGCRVSLIFSDKIQDSQNFYGCPVLDQFYDDPKIFDKIPKDVILQPAVATLDTKPSPNNPFRTKTIITKLETDSDVINLL